MKPLLEIDAVTKAFGAGAAAKVVLDRVSLKVREGEFVAIVGYSGTGKSTLLSLLAGLMKPDSGSIRLGGTAITGPGTDRGIVFQHYSLLPWLTVAENIRLAVDQVFPHESGEQRAQRVARMISLVHLSHAADKRPHELSGGMKQRVAVARALAMDPKILLLDEPFGALDALTRGTLQEELEKIYEADRKTVVMITNDVDEALLLADRIVPLLPNGSLGESIVVELPRPRERAALIEDPRYRILRNEMTDALRRSGLDAIDATGRLGAPPTVQSNRERAAHKSERGEGEVTTGRGGPFLELRKLNKIYETPRGPQVIVKDIDLTIGEHEFVSIIGHSGCGKTTVLSMVAGLTKPTAGAIVIGGREVLGPGPERAMVFQQHSLLPWLTALENVELGVDSAFSKASAAERRSIAEYALDRVGLFAARNQKPADLSAGMRQRVGVARAFALSPQLLLLDEPFGSLDSVTRAELQDVLLELWGKSRTAALLVTHDIDEAIYLSDRIVLMTDGPAAEIGAILEVKFPRPRDRATIIDLPEYATLRSRMIDFLEHTSASRATRTSRSIVVS